MADLVCIQGSTVRDFQMLERNLLAHLRLAVLLALLFCSILLNARLPTSTPSSGGTPRSKSDIPIAALDVTAAVAAIAAGVWEFHQGFKDMRDMRGFLEATKSHFIIMILVTLIVFATCMVYLVDKSS